MGASVKIMLSYDYCHFEICKSTDENIPDSQINEMRKDCQRLADEAIRQYKIAKRNASRRVDAEYRMQNFESQCLQIEAKQECDRTLKEVAMLKQYQDENWREQFTHQYDYEDDGETYFFRKEDNNVR